MAGNKNSGRRGRPPDWFRAVCLEILDHEKLVEFVGRVAVGKETEEKVIANPHGGYQIVKVACDVSTRLEAFKLLAMWGVGKPTQVIITAPQTPDESVRNVQQMFELVRAASSRPQLTVPDAELAKKMGEGNGANGHP